jgi:prepilin-type N-terminal cleavage/methylation domain-containing protein
MSHPNLTSFAGFTLAELLISLALLGIIATFSVTKIMIASTEAKKVSIFRENVSTFNQILYQGLLTGDLTITNFNTYLIERFNATRNLFIQCPNRRLLASNP